MFGFGRKKGLTPRQRPRIDPWVKQQVHKRDGFTCVYCKRKLPISELHVDHLHPVSKGGGDSRKNLVTACRDCNLAKSNKELRGRRRSTKIKKYGKERQKVIERRTQSEIKNLEFLKKNAKGKEAKQIDDLIKVKKKEIPNESDGESSDPVEEAREESRDIE
jgi:hypothetical protein